MGIRKQAVLESVVLALLAAGAAGVAAWFVVPPGLYKAEARLHVAAKQPSVLFPIVETQNAGASDYVRYQNTQKTLVKSRLVLSVALSDPKVGRYLEVREQVDPIAWLQEKLKVEFVGGSEVMEISLAGRIPEEVAGIVNAIKRAYIDEVVNVDLKRRVERFDQLKKLKEQYTELLKKRRETMRKLAYSVEPNDQLTLALRQQYATEHVHELLTQRNRLWLEQSEVETLLARRRKAETAATDPARKEIAQLEDRLAVVIAGQKLIREAEQRLVPNLGETLTRNTLDLSGEQEEIALIQAAAERVGQEVEVLTVELEALPRIRLIDEATVPPTSDDKERLTIIGLLTSCAFFAALYGVAWIRVARFRPAASAGDACGFEA